MIVAISIINFSCYLKKMMICEAKLYLPPNDGGGFFSRGAVQGRVNLKRSTTS
jgi:hypothetical protein